MEMEALATHKEVKAEALLGEAILVQVDKEVVAQDKVAKWEAKVAAVQVAQVQEAKWEVAHQAAAVQEVVQCQDLLLREEALAVAVQALALVVNKAWANKEDPHLANPLLLLLLLRHQAKAQCKALLHREEAHLVVQVAHLVVLVAVHQATNKDLLNKVVAHLVAQAVREDKEEVALADNKEALQVEAD